MAIYHLSTKPIKRSSGRSATASSAYRAGAKLEDKRTGKVHDYTKKSGVVFSKCLLATDDNIQELDRSELWNLAEQSEKRKDARTAREIIVNIPFELSEDERQKLVDDFAVKLSKDFGVAVDYAIHLPDKNGDNRNHHAHIMMTTRNATYENDELKLHDKTRLELSNTKLKELELPKTQEQIKSLREDWANITNTALERNNIDARIDHRSYADQSKDKIPSLKLGWRASKLERQGVKTHKGDLNRQIELDNQRISELKNELYLDKGRLSARNKKDELKEQHEQELREQIEQRRRQQKDKEPIQGQDRPLTLLEKRELWKQQQAQQQEPEQKHEQQKSEPKPEPEPPVQSKSRGLTR